jgi:hypothetical protein
MELGDLYPKKKKKKNPIIVVFFCGFFSSGSIFDLIFNYNIFFLFKLIFFLFKFYTKIRKMIVKKNFLSFIFVQGMVIFLVDVVH